MKPKHVIMGACVISILDMWVECLFRKAEVVGSNPGISMSCPREIYLICNTSVDSAVKCIAGLDNLVNGVQYYELFGVKKLKNHAFYAHLILLLPLFPVCEMLLMYM